MPTRGLVNVFLCHWQLAKDSFESALQLEPTNTTLKNNIAVCTFYQGYLKEVSVSPHIVAHNNGVITGVQVVRCCQLTVK